MSDLLALGASGVRTYQTALSTVSENIANAGTVGYSQRTVDVREVAASAGSGVATINGMGSMVQGVTRSADDFRAAEVRTAGADLAKTEASATWLDRIQSALTSYGLGDQLTAFFNAADTLAADTSASGARATMLESASSVASAFSGTSNALASAADELDSTTQSAVASLNTMATSLARINDAIGRATPGTSGQASLLDQRDQLLEQMSAITDTQVTLDTAGRATVRLGGATGPVLVSGDQAATVAYARNDEGAVAYSVNSNGTSASFAPSGGALAGLAEAAQKLAGAQATLNGIASGFVAGVNAVQAEGQDLSGNAGAPMFAAGDPPANVTVVLTDPSGIAAAAVGGGTRDNSNLAGFDALRSSGNAEGALTDLVSTNAAALSARQSVAAAQTTIRDNAVAARDSVSGVSLDEEAVDLMRFQQAYQASSRVIQIAREIFQTMVEIR